MRILVKTGAAILGAVLPCLTGTGLAQPTGITVGSKNIGAVWFIGDSITQSNADGDANGSPRKALYDLLLANGYSFSFTGHYTDNVDGLPTTGGTADTNLYQYHSGISGSVIGSDISGRVGMTQNTPSFWTSGRLATVKPNVILIMLGTNDVDQNIDLANAPARLTTLVNTIYAQPGVGTPCVFVASIPPNRTNVPDDPTHTATFNAAVPGVVSAQRSLGRDVRFVDQFTPLESAYATAMAGDNLHTNTTGNATLARQWFNAIDAVANPLAPLITVEQPAGNPLPSGSYLVHFRTSLIGTGTPLTFTVRNTGRLALSSFAITFDGANSNDYAVTTAPATAVAAGASTTFTVTFTPSAGGARLANLSIASNAAAKNPFKLRLTGNGNTAPAFAGYQAATAYQTASEISIVTLLARASDADGDDLTIFLPAPTTTNGGAVALQSGSILYTPPFGFSGADTFPVTFTDPSGASASGTVTMVVHVSGWAQALQPPKLTVLADGSIKLRFLGIAGQIYQVQRSTDLSDWTPLFTAATNGDGTLTFTDANPPVASGYYRVASP
jgi:hypothetical protein